VLTGASISLTRSRVLVTTTVTGSQQRFCVRDSVSPLDILRKYADGADPHQSDRRYSEQQPRFASSDTPQPKLSVERFAGGRP
jgi:hypothetical protein